MGCGVGRIAGADCVIGVPCDDGAAGCCGVRPGRTSWGCDGAGDSDGEGERDSGALLPGGGGATGAVPVAGRCIVDPYGGVTFAGCATGDGAPDGWRVIVPDDGGLTGDVPDDGRVIVPEGGVAEGAGVP